MALLENDIKDFVRARGVEVVGTAGPERLDGPPSLDLSYTMPGARSVVSMALPMDTDAIYDFLCKRSPTTTTWTSSSAISACSAWARNSPTSWSRAAIVPPECP